MRTFQISKKISVDCKSEDTRSGFRHLATLYRDYVVIGKAKCTYINRTWERFTFESVLAKIAELDVLTDKDKKAFKIYLKRDDRVEDDLKPLKTIAMVAAMGNILAPNQKAKNDWKTRMLKAGLESKGLIMPDDWDQLDEDTKQVRLDAVITHLQ